MLRLSSYDLLHWMTYVLTFLSSPNCLLAFLISTGGRDTLSGRNTTRTTTFAFCVVCFCATTTPAAPTFATATTATFVAACIAYTITARAADATGATTAAAAFNTTTATASGRT